MAFFRKIALSAVAAVASFGPALPGIAAQPSPVSASAALPGKPSGDKPTVALVHRAHADSSGRKKVIQVSRPGASTHPIEELDHSTR
jgi:hypothetical protein